jgi:cytochrome P450
METPARIDLEDQHFLANRHQEYQRLRRDAPVATTMLNGELTVILSRYADVDSVLKDPLASVQPSVGEFPPYIGTGAASIFYKLSLPHMDPPEHTRLRRILTPALNPQAVAQMGDWVTEIIDRHLDRLEQHTVADLVYDLAATIPADVGCRLLHVPIEQAGLLFSRVKELNSIVSHTELDAGALAKADSAAQFYFDYFTSVVNRNRHLPETELLGALIRSEVAGLMSRDELVVTLMGIFLAGYHTTKVSISNALHNLAIHPEQRLLLVDNSSLAGRAWEEILRYDGPVHFVHRYFAEPATIGGHRVERRTRILLALASANRDAEKFGDADRFDICRTNTGHLAFASGAHFCLGSQLSRLEGKLFLPAFLRRFPNFKLADEPLRRNHDLTFPHLEVLNAVLRPE